MATFTSANPVKISAAVSASGAATAGVIYTCGAGNYALINVSANGSNITVSIGGQQTKVSSTNLIPTLLVVGPSQTVSIGGSGGGGTAYISGVEFTNSF